MKEKDHLADQGVYARITLQYMIKKYDGMGWIGLFWCGTGALVKNDNDTFS